MSLPAGWATAEVRVGPYIGTDGEIEEGQVEFLPRPNRLVFDGTPIVRRKIIIELDENGEGVGEIPVMDDPDIVPSGWTWFVKERFLGGGGDSYDITVGLADVAGGVDLAERAPEPIVAFGDFRNTYRAEMQDELDTRVAAVEADRAFVEARVVDDLGTTDGQTKALIETPSSETAQALSATYVSVNEEPLNIARTAALDGTTDDTAAWNAAIAAANAASGKVQIRHPGGVSKVTSSSRLTPITNVNTSIVGDPGAISQISFSHANGGLDIGDGSAFVYLTQIQNITIDGAGVATTPLRFRKSEEAHLENVRFQNHPATALELNETSLFTSRRIQVSSGGTVGVKMTGQCGSLTFSEANIYDTDEPFQIAGPGVARLLIADSWIEACPDVVTLNRPGNPISIGQINIRDLYSVTSTTSARVIRAIAASFINVDATLQNSRIVANSSTSPVVDFTAVDNSAGTARVRMASLSLDMAALAADLVKVHTAQAWYLFHVDMDRINGVTTDKWIDQWYITGGVWPTPWRLHGVGSPETAVVAPVGSTFQRSDGFASAVLYVKEGGTGNTGWAAK